MKRNYVMILCIVLLLGLIGGLYIYQNNQKLDDIPTKELAWMQLDSKGVDFVLNQIKGHSRDDILEKWGEPDNHLFGFWGDVWLIDSENVTYIILYYDSKGNVEDIKLNKLD